MLRQAVCPLDYTVIEVSGQDAQTFLQGQLTCDLLQDKQVFMGAHCNLKGRVTSLFDVLVVEAGYYLVMPTSLVKKAFKRLSRYLLHTQCTITVQEAYKVYGLLGESLPIQQGLAPYRVAEQVDQVCGQLHEGEQIFDYLIIKEGNLPESAGSQDDWLAARLTQHQVPWLIRETREVFLPHELGLDQLGAVSVQKGCYVGQEIVARLHFLGKPKFLPKLVSAPSEEGKLICQVGGYALILAPVSLTT